MSKFVILKLDDGSEWKGRIPDKVEHYMAGMADEIQRLRADNERLRAALQAMEQMPNTQKAPDAPTTAECAELNDWKLSQLIGERLNGDQVTAIRRYVRAAKDANREAAIRARMAEEELKRVRKLLKKALKKQES